MPHNRQIDSTVVLLLCSGSHVCSAVFAFQIQKIVSIWNYFNIYCDCIVISNVVHLTPILYSWWGKNLFHSPKQNWTMNYTIIVAHNLNVRTCLWLLPLCQSVTQRHREPTQDETHWAKVQQNLRNVFAPQNAKFFKFTFFFKYNQLAKYWASFMILMTLTFD